MSINYTITEEDHTVTYTVEEGIGATGSAANVTNANVNLAISDNPQATRDALEIPINNFTATGAPTANDDETEGYSEGSKWYGGGEAYLCVDPTEGAAVWIKTTLTADELGDAAFKDTGSTAGTVAAGDDSRLSDARTPTAHTHVSSEITDATSNATPNAIVRRNDTGSASFSSSDIGAAVNATAELGAIAVSAQSSSGDAVYASSETGTAVNTYSPLNYGLQAWSGSSSGSLSVSVSGEKHAEFGESGNNRSFVRRVLGLFGWHRGSFVQTLGSQATLTANRDVTLPDESGTVALTSDPRFSDSRTPTAHASTHVTGGADKIRDASAAQDGLMTTAFASKLDGIAANANNYTHPNHSGDVTSVGDGAQTIANNAVTFAKMQDVSGTVLVGRHAGGSGDPQEVSVGNGVEFQGSGIRRSALTGDVTVSAGSNTTTLQGSAVAARINGADSKTTPVDADELGIADSAASFGLKKLTFANLFAYILTKIQAAASIVFTGQLRSSNQTAATGDAVMTRDLADARYMYEAYPRWRQIPLVFTGSSSGAGVTTTTTFGSSQINITANTTNQWGRLSRRIDASFFNTYVNAVNRARRYSITIEPGFGSGLSNDGDRSMAIGFNLSGTDPMDSSTLFPSGTPGFALVFIISTTPNRGAVKLVANQAASQVESTPSGAIAITAVNEQHAYKIIFQESYLNSTHNRITVNMYTVSNISSNGYPTNDLRTDSYSASVDVAREGVAAVGGGYVNLSFLCRDQSVNSGSCQLRPQEVLIFD
jgi:hypothetical protein